MTHWLILPVVLPAFLAPFIVLAARYHITIQRVFSVAGTLALIAVRDSIIEEQQAVIHCLWRVLEWGGIGRARAFQIAAEHGLPGPLPGVTNEDPASAGARLEQQLTGARAAQRYKWWKARPRGGADASKEAGGGGGGGGPSSHSPRE